MSLIQHLHRIIASQTPVQIQLRGSSSPMGPGKVEAIDFEFGETVHIARDPASWPRSSLLIYRIRLQGGMQSPNGGKVTPVIVPIVFDGADLVAILEPPSAVEQPAIVGPGNGGLHILGRE